jgi:hypothetical protein
MQEKHGRSASADADTNARTGRVNPPGVEALKHHVHLERRSRNRKS